MRKIVTFLGKYPRETQYEFGGATYTGRVFAEALRQFITYDEMLVFITDEAREHAWPVLSKLGDARIKDVPIGRGETTEQMWAMFDALKDRVGENDSVVFDITHGLRSSPFLVFLFAAYLKTVKRVSIDAVYYGAFELGDPEKGRPAPVVNLSGFVTVLDWIVASERFIHYGDAQQLAGLLRQAGNAGQLDEIEKASETLELLSQSLRLSRPIEAMQYSAALADVMAAANIPAAALDAARPYLFLDQDIRKAYADFSLEAPFDPANIDVTLRKQRDLVNWYIDHQQWVQAVTLAREWLISWVMLHLGETDLLERELRESIGRTISDEAQRRREAKQNQREFRPLFLGHVPQIDSMLGTWLSLTGVRNELAHSGHRKGGQGVKGLSKSIRTLCGKLNSLPLDVGD